MFVNIQIKSTNTTKYLHRGLTKSLLVNPSPDCTKSSPRYRWGRHVLIVNALNAQLYQQSVWCLEQLSRCTRSWLARESSFVHRSALCRTTSASTVSSARRFDKRTLSQCLHWVMFVDLSPSIPYFRSVSA